MTVPLRTFADPSSVGLLHHAVFSIGWLADALPLWLTILGVVGMPAVTLLGLIWSFFHSARKLEATRTEIGGLVATQTLQNNGKMDLLIKLATESGHAAGVLEERDRQTADALVLKRQIAANDALRAQGAADLLKAQGTPPAVTPP